MLAEVTPAKFKYMSLVSCQPQLIIVLLISNRLLLVVQNQDTVPTTPKISFMVGIKMTSRLMITKRTTVTKTWRHKSNFVFLASSNNDERTCRKREKQFSVRNILQANSKLAVFILTGSSCANKFCIDLSETQGSLMQHPLKKSLKSIWYFKTIGIYASAAGYSSLSNMPLGSFCT